jgi:hypothetical protein
MKKPKYYWNFRIVTELCDYSSITDPDHPCNSDPNFQPERIFSIVEMHYKNGKPTDYSDTHQINGGRLINVDSVKSLKGDYKKIKEAFKKPIIDGDNFPKKWKK